MLGAPPGALSFYGIGVRSLWTMKTPTEQSANFTYDFILDQKAVEINDEDGDLYISGYASDFGMDRQDEAFEPGAFDRGLKSFMERNPVLLYHHKFDKALGQVVEAEVDNIGLRVKARVDRPEDGSWAKDIYSKVKKGTIRGFSVGGIFRRKMTEKGWKIHDVDLCEISVTPFPVNPRTTFALTAGKAFENVELPTKEEVAEADIRDADKEMMAYLLESLERTLESIGNRKQGGKIEEAEDLNNGGDSIL